MDFYHPLCTHLTILWQRCQNSSRAAHHEDQKQRQQWGNEAAMANDIVITIFNNCNYHSDLQHLTEKPPYLNLVILTDILEWLIWSDKRKNTLYKLLCTCSRWEAMQHPAGVVSAGEWKEESGLSSSGMKLSLGYTCNIVLVMEDSVVHSKVLHFCFVLLVWHLPHPFSFLQFTFEC